MCDNTGRREAACPSFLRNSENRNRENLQRLARGIPAIAARLKFREHDSPGFSNPKGEGFDDVFSSTLRKLHGEANVFYIGHRSRCNQSQFAAAPTSAIYADIIPEHSSAEEESRCDRSHRSSFSYTSNVDNFVITHEANVYLRDRCAKKSSATPGNSSRKTARVSLCRRKFVNFIGVL